MAAALCYVLGFVTGILFLVLEPYNRNRLIRFHAWQSIFFSAAYVVLQVALGFMWFDSSIIFLWMAIRLLFLGVWLYMMYTAYNNQKIKLPLLGDLAEKQA